MVQFIAFDARVENLGSGVKVLENAAGEGIRPILEKHNLLNVDANAWYPHQPLLDCYRDIAEGGFQGMMNLVSIGMRIPEDAIFPPGINDVPTALESINIAYQMQHRGGEIGYYRAVHLSPREIMMQCHNPYPSDFDYGIIYAMVKRFRPKGAQFLVRRNDAGPSRLKGADMCQYFVTWS